MLVKVTAMPNMLAFPIPTIGERYSWVSLRAGSSLWDILKAPYRIVVAWKLDVSAADACSCLLEICKSLSAGHLNSCLLHRP